MAEGNTVAAFADALPEPFFHLPDPFLVSLEEQTRELVAADPVGHGAAVGRVVQAFSDRGQGLVAGLMADEARREPRPLVGDSALRPPFWPEPLFRLAGRLGLRLAYGSDPLPGAGNARRAGMYATLVDAAPTPSCAALLRALREAPMRPCGRRALI